MTRLDRVPDELLIREIRRRGWKVEADVTVKVDRASGIYYDFIDEIAHDFGIDVYLPKGPAKVLQALIMSSPREVDTKRLVDVIYADRSDGGPLSAEKIIHQAIFKIREQLHGTNYVIRSNSFGYSLIRLPRQA